MTTTRSRRRNSPWMLPVLFVRWLFRAIAGWFRHLGTSFHEFFSEEPEDTPLPDTFAKVAENPSALLEQLDALRKHLLRAVIVLAITTGVSFTYATKILTLLAAPLPKGLNGMLANEVTEPIGTLMKVSLLSGFAIALPYIVLELWLFIGPGLSRRARITGLFSIPVVVVFFLAGMAFAYFVMLPTAIPWLVGILPIPVQIRPTKYIDFVTSLLFWVGIAFEFPLVIFMLAGVGLVKARDLLNQWRLAIVLIAVAAAAITPTVDPVNMSLVMAPMIILYFLSIGLAFLAQRGRTTT